MYQDIELTYLYASSIVAAENNILMLQGTMSRSGCAEDTIQ